MQIVPASKPIFIPSKAYYMAKFVTRGTAALHEEMLIRLIKSPMLFYDTVSVGSIINRFVIDFQSSKVCWNQFPFSQILIIDWGDKRRPLIIINSHLYISIHILRWRWMMSSYAREWVLVKILRLRFGQDLIWVKILWCGNF